MRRAMVSSRVVESASSSRVEAAGIEVLPTGSARPADSSTAWGSMAARRPQAKAVLFISIAAPLSSIARTRASKLIGTRPRCQATPSMNRLVAMASPISEVAISVAAICSGSRPPMAVRMASTMPAAGNCMSGMRVNGPGMAW